MARVAGLRPFIGPGFRTRRIPIWPVAELTDDVREMKQFLTDTCADVNRWLPEPEWRPGWQFDASGRLAAEIASADGERRLPPRGCGLYLDAVDPLDPPVAPPPGGHEAHREPVIG